MAAYWQLFSGVEHGNSFATVPNKKAGPEGPASLTGRVPERRLEARGRGNLSGMIIKTRPNSRRLDLNQPQIKKPDPKVRQFNREGQRGAWGSAGEERTLWHDYQSI
jgi:hypothetical protein